MKRLLPTLILLFCCASLSAQQNSYEDYLNNHPVSEELVVPESDSYIFNTQPGDGPDIYGQLATYNFSSIRFSRRGIPGRDRKLYFGLSSLGSALSSSTNYALSSLISRTGYSSAAGSSYFIGSNGSDIRNTALDNDPWNTNTRRALTIYSTNRRAKGGAHININRNRGNKRLILSYSGRWGRDFSIEGIFRNENSALASYSIKLDERQTLSFTTLFTNGQRGLRSYSTKEAFELTGDNLYNPSWGYFDGRVRNGKVTERLNCIIILDYKNRISEKISIRGELKISHDNDTYSTLSWRNADTPYPDYFRKMPGFSYNQEIESYWRDKDAETIQLAWSRMVDENRLSTDGALYFIEKRTDRINDISFSSQLEAALDKRTSALFGIDAGAGKLESFKTVSDLLGGTPFRDDDFYLDGNPPNDLRNPDRVAGKGDRFGYNYEMTIKEGTVSALILHRNDRLTLQAGVQAGITTIQRDGRYEKSNYPGGESFGKSEKLKFETYAIKGRITAPLPWKAFAGLSATYNSEVPYYGRLFLSPLYSNKTIHNKKTVNRTDLELNYTQYYRKLTFTVAAFYGTTGSESEVYSFYDDLSGNYANLILSDMKTCRRGIEASFRAELSNRITVSVATCLAKYRYSNHPGADLLVNETFEPILTNSRSYLKGYRLGNSPEQTITGEVKYSRYGFIASASLNYAAARYITATPLRRMERYYNLMASPETYTDFLIQEKLPDSFTVNLFLFKSFRIKESSLNFVFSVNNLLNKKDIIYGGYEQLRIIDRGSGSNTNWSPLDSKYLYSYGRTFYLSAGLSF